jgi:HAD superfamily hydrolase (TIGR01662 family)
MAVNADIVIPTVGRRSLARLIARLATGTRPPGRVLVVDDRRDASCQLRLGKHAVSLDVAILRGSHRGPAAARNIGWKASTAAWICFLDDDVEPGADWADRLDADLSCLKPEVGGSQGRLRVPVPARPTDWQRNVQGLENAEWITADMAYRRSALHSVGGFDERFCRAYREDADLALRVRDAGYRLCRGTRLCEHPVPEASRWKSVRLQSGNADDVLMRALHGRRWRERAGAPRGRRARHALTVAAGVAAAGAVVRGRRRLAGLAGAAWLAQTAELTWHRFAPGPRTLDEAVTIAATSAAIPPVAIGHWLSGWLMLLAHLREAGPKPPLAGPPAAVLFDRDGTLVVDVPHNGDPAKVIPMPGARSAVRRLRAAGVQVGVVTNQSAGLVTADDVDTVNRRIGALIRGIEVWAICTHAPGAGCACRKPAPGLVWHAASALGVDPAECVVIGDTGADVEAARAAGARPILVPNAVTRPEEVAAAPEWAPDMKTAVDRILEARG